jgi:polar amino acid transport system substrate-binding protein
MSRCYCKYPAIGAALLAAVHLMAMPSVDTIYLVSTNYPPYYGKGLVDGGVLTQITTEAFRRAGYTLKVEWLPWARAVNIAKEGRVDGVMGIWYSKEREDDFAFSLPLLNTEVGFYRRADSRISFKSLQDLKPYRIGVVRSSTGPKGFDQAGLTIDEAVDGESNLRKLDARRVDLALIEKSAAEYLIANKLIDFKDWLVWTGPLEVMPMYVGFSRQAFNYEKKRAAFNKGLKEMERDGTLARLLGQALPLMRYQGDPYARTVQNFHSPDYCIRTDGRSAARGRGHQLDQFIFPQQRADRRRHTQRAGQNLC